MFYRVFGPPRSGKKDFLFSLAKKAREAGERVYVIVPEQMAAECEKDLVRLLGNSCSLFVEVTNFSRLSNVVLRQYGRLCKRSVTEEEKKLLFARALKENREGLSGLPARLNSDTVELLLSEWEEARRAGLDASSMTALAKGEVPSERFREKLLSFGLIGAVYRTEMEKRFSDPLGEQERLAEILETYPFFEESTVLLYGFWDFTAPQEALLRRFLANAKTVAVAFTAKKGQESLFEKSLTAARRALRFAREAGCEVRDVNLEEESSGDALSFLRRSFEGCDGCFEGVPEGVSMAACSSEEEEARFVARTIRKKVMEGAAWKDFAVLFPSLEGKEIFALTLAAEGIPTFFQSKKPFSASSLAQTLLLATRIATLFSPEETLREYLNTGVFSCREEERFLLEKYIATWSLTGRSLLDGKPFTANPEGYAPLTEDGVEELERVNCAKKQIFEPLRRLSFALSAGKNEEKVAALVAFLTEVGAEKNLLKEIGKKKEEGQFDAVAERVREWNCVLERLSGLARVAGELSVSSEDFYELLTLALSGELPGELPTGQDRVSLGKLGFARPKAKYVFVTDLTSGVFPPPPQKGRFFNDEERAFLSERGFPLSHPLQEQRDAAFYLYLAICAAEEEIFFSYLVKNEGEDTKSSLSVLGKRLLSLVPEMPCSAFSSKDLAPLTRNQALRYLLSHSDEEGNDFLAQYLFADPTDRQRLLSLLSGKGKGMENAALEEVFPYEEGDVSMTYSRLETYSRCRFSYFARYLLEAKKRNKASLAANITGSFVHRVMEKVLVRLGGEGKSIGALSSKELSEYNDLACKEAVFEICPEGMEDGRTAMQFSAICRSTRLILENLRKEFSESGFEPLWFEKDLTETGGPYRVPLKDGTTLCLYGTIDRVDRYVSKKGEEYLRVVDYKTGSQSFRLEDVANGLDLQMLLYLFALWGRKTSEDREKGVLPAGILYLSGMGRPVSCDSKDDLQKAEELPFFGLKREGLLVEDEELLSAQDPAGQGAWIPVKRLASGAFQNKNLVSMEKLGRLKRKTEADFARLAEELKSGRIETNPLYSPSGAIDPCRYCDHLPICKRKESAYRPYLINPTEDDIFGKEIEE